MVATGRFNLGGVYVEAGKLEDAEKIYREVLGLRERTLDAEHPLLTRSRAALADVLARRGKHEEAERLLGDR